MKDHLNLTTINLMPMLTRTEVPRRAPDQAPTGIAVGEGRPLLSTVVPLQRDHRAPAGAYGRPATVTMACAEAAGLSDELPDIGAVIDRMRR